MKVQQSALKTTKNITRMQQKSREDNVSEIPFIIKALCYFVTTALSISAMIPLLLTISISFTDDTTLIMEGYRLIPSNWSSEAYSYLFKLGGQICRSYGVTIFITITGTLWGLFVMTMYAYTITRTDFPWKSQFSFFVLFTMLFNGGLVPTYIVISNLLKMRDTIFALILPLSVNATYIIIFRTYIRTSVPASVVESAKLDGAGDFLCYYRIVIPMCTPVIATIALFLATSYWNGWYHAFLYVIKNEDIVPIQLLLKRIENNLNYLANSTKNISYAEAEILRESLPTESVKMALVVIVVLPILVSYPFFQKFFVKGITIGAVKG